MYHMYTNGRSAAPRRGYAIRTSDPQRRAKWDRLLGLDALPVVSPWPVEMVQPDGTSGHYYEIEQGWFLSAENCVLVERPETAVSPAFLLPTPRWGRAVSFA
jgi:hypothetical protein